MAKESWEKIKELGTGYGKFGDEVQSLPKKKKTKSKKNTSKTSKKKKT